MIALDLGSNTLRAIEYDGKNWGTSFEKVVRTAQALNETGKISDVARDRIIDALCDAQKVINFADQKIVAVTTAAMRMADNSAEVLRAIWEKTGVLFSIIDGEEEAKLTLMAVQNRLEQLSLPKSDLILVDIGGGSTEIVVVLANQVYPKSFSLGIVTLGEQSKTHEELNGSLKLWQETIALHIASLGLFSSSFVLVMTAGTPTTIAAYKLGMNYHSYDPRKINGSSISKSDCAYTLEALVGMDEEARAYYVGTGREELIIAGIKIVETIFDALEINEAVVIDDGLREGVALDYYFQNQLPNLT